MRGSFYWIILLATGWLRDLERVVKSIASKVLIVFCKERFKAELILCIAFYS